MKEQFIKISEDDKFPQEECGIFIAFSPNGPDNLLSLGYSGALGVQTRGQQGVGLSLQTEDGLLHYTAKGLVTEAITERRQRKLDKPGTWITVHTRYGTNGGYIKDNLQPCVVKSPEGEDISLIHNGEFVGVDRMRKILPYKLHPKASDTLVLTHVLANSQGGSWEEKVLNTFASDKANGAISAAVGIGSKMFLIRDEFGLKPFVLGKREDTIIATSETHALNKVGAELIREIKRGEIVRIDENGIKVLREGKDGPGNFCDAEWFYYSRPDSNLPTHEKSDDSTHPERWMSVLRFRERCGERLAEEYPITHADFAIGIPDSGVPAGFGYANKLGIPYRQVIIRDHFDPNGNKRLFQGDDEMSKIASKVLGKLSLIPDPEIWQGKVVVIVDDSIVRGNVYSKVVRAIFAMGAKEVHALSASPEIGYNCYLGVSIRNRNELIAARNNWDHRKIAEELGATSAGYISRRGFIQARYLNRNIIIPGNENEIFLDNGGCGGCITGIYPISKEGIIYQREKERVLANL